MTKQEINTCFELMIDHNKKLLKWLPIVGISLVVIGAIVYFMVSNHDAIIIAQLILGLGVAVLLFFTPIIYFSSISTRKKIDEIQAILASEPKKLIWAYIYQITQNGVKNEFIVMKFRDGQELQIHKSTIKNNTLEEFLSALRVLYNENITLGFSEEIKQNYLNGKL